MAGKTTNKSTRKITQRTKRRSTQPTKNQVKKRETFLFETFLFETFQFHTKFDIYMHCSDFERHRSEPSHEHRVNNAARKVKKGPRPNKDNDKDEDIRSAKTADRQPTP